EGHLKAVARFALAMLTGDGAIARLYLSWRSGMKKQHHETLPGPAQSGPGRLSRYSRLLEIFQLRLRLLKRIVQAHLIREVRRSVVLDHRQGLDELRMERPHANHTCIGVHLQLLDEPVVLRRFCQDRLARIEEPEANLHSFHRHGGRNEEAEQLLSFFEVGRGV